VAPKRHTMASAGELIEMLAEQKKHAHGPVA
jgi:hypothetical protein